MSEKTGMISIKKMILVIGIIFVAFNLRPAITSVGPLIGSIRHDLGISNGTAGLLTTLPLLAFAFLSPLAPRIGQKYGNEMTVFLGLIVLLIGIAIRSLGMTVALFVGTALIGVGIAIGNVLLPSIVKHHFPERVGILTSLYSTSQWIFAAVASGVSIPLAQKLPYGWQGSLIIWASLVVLALIIWSPQLLNKEMSSMQQQGVVPVKSTLWRSSLAWKVTIFMGLHSFLFYCTIAWLTEILHAQGMSVSISGWMLSLMQFAGLPATFFTPILADRFSNQKGIVLVIGFLYLSGLFGLFSGVFASQSMILIIISILFIGLGQGAYLSLSLVFFGLRTDNAQQARELSGMAQSFGYLLAAIGPVFIGFLFDFTHSWTSPLIIFLIVGIFMVISGYGAGENKHVLEPTQKSVFS